MVICPTSMTKGMIMQTTVGLWDELIEAIGR